MSAAPQPSAQQRSLYRRHRPRTFDDVVGQESVVRTLRNAVELDRVHHAYLFVGSRGTGKTSIAKILAACLNCERGRSAKPCGVCDSCVAIADARSLDVIEMDAASHNSVEDIRDLRESVAFQPLSGRSKVYILDEAHMLSNAAWNAFLKTLEEPPPSTVFVMATTEAQKVPATVIDRCHRFDFQRPTVEQVATVIARTAQAESIAIPADAVAALAKSANGSFRDALGALEQIVTYGGQQVSLQDVLAVLGIADFELVEEALDAVAAGDARGALLAVQRCVDGGRDVAALAAELEQRARELMVVQVLGEVPRELALTEDHDHRLGEQARRTDAALLSRVIDLLGFATQVTKAGGDARTQLELALLKAARPEVDPSTKALLARIERLESGNAAARFDVAASEPRAAPAPRPADRAPNASDDDALAPASAPATDAPDAAAPDTSDHAGADTSDHAGADTSDHAGADTSDHAGADTSDHAGAGAGDDDAIAPSAAPPAPPSAGATAPERTPADAGNGNAAAAQAAEVPTNGDGAPGNAAVDGDRGGAAEFPVNGSGAPGGAADGSGAPGGAADGGGAFAEVAAANGAAGLAGAAGDGVAVEPGMATIRDSWLAIVGLVREGNALFGAVIAEAVPFALVDGELTVAFPQSSSFNKRKAESATCKEALGDAIRTLTGQRLRLAYELREDVVSPDADDGAAGSAGDDDLVRRIMVEFDAEELPEGWSPGSSETQEGR